MKYSIVIPTYNHCDDLLKPCVDSIIKYSNLEDIELVISYNGCTDETKHYVTYLTQMFENKKLGHNIKYYANEKPAGYAKATNDGIKVATCDKIILLNNDTILLDQTKNQWLEMLEAPFLQDSSVGISGPVVQYSPDAKHDFCVFFCVMIHRKVFDKIGLLNEEYGVGTGEDVEFCIEAIRAGFKMKQLGPKILQSDFWVGEFPIYHVGEGTVHDTELVKDFNKVFSDNCEKLAKKYG
jgi:GT2 family glycosyltransferase